MKVLALRFTDAERAAIDKLVAAVTPEHAASFGLAPAEHACLRRFDTKLDVVLPAHEPELHTLQRLLATTSQNEHLAAGLTKRQADKLYYVYEQLVSMGYLGADPHPSVVS